MTEVRLHQALYHRSAVDEVVGLYAEFATLELIDTGEHFVIRISSDDAARERLLGRELTNAALGLTIDRRGQA